MADIEIEIDGKKLTAKPNQTVIQVADEAGIYIPRFCYHKHLSIPANCRMCLVEVEKSPKTLPACSTPVAPGLKVFTRSAKTLASQRAVMEFLLINHPLDCPICDQGGECELQDLAMGYGSPWSHFDECKHSVSDENLGPLISTEMTRCIKCTRCVRFGDEIAGLPELGVIDRGEDTDISTYIQKAVTSELSGNIIDVCPVGALTSKPFRFTARPWELDQAPSVNPHDCTGSGINVHTLYGKVMRVAPLENDDINETWIADRERYSYTGLYHEDRLEEPLARLDGKLQVVEWQKALELAALGLQEAVAEFGSDKLGALASPNSTLEEFYLLQKIIRGLGSPHVDHRLREMDMRDQANMPAFPGLGMSLPELEQCDAILLIGSNIQKEQPIACLRLRKAAQKGAVILAVNPVDYRFNFKTSAKIITAPHQLLKCLAEIENALRGNVSGEHPVAAQLKGKQKVCILLGALALNHPQAAAIRFLAQQIAAACNGKLAMMTDGANSAGGWLAGMLPHRLPGGTAINQPGLDAYAMLHKARKAYVLMNVEPDLDCANAAHAVEALKQARFVIALSVFRNPVLEEHADIVLPMAPFTETSGTFINTTGIWQSFNGTAKAFGASRPAWKILRVLGNFLHLEGFDYESSEEIRHEVKNLIEKMHAPETKSFTAPEKAAHENIYSRIGEVPIYAGDSLVRRAKPLQQAQNLMEGDVAAARMHPDTAVKLQVENGSQISIRQHPGEAAMTVVLDPRVAVDAVWVAGGIKAGERLGDLMGAVEIRKV